MTRMIMFIGLMMASVGAMAQSGFGVTGGDVSNASGSLSYTTGQIAVGTNYGRVTNASRVAANLREGVQQTYSVEELGIEGVPALEVEISVYPNPTTDEVTVSTGQAEEGMRYELYGIDGRLLEKGRVTEREQKIDMGRWAAGSYVLRIVAGKAENRYRIVRVSG